MKINGDIKNMEQHKLNINNFVILINDKNMNLKNILSLKQMKYII